MWPHTPILRIEVERIQLYAPPRISCYVLFQSVKQIEPVVGSEFGRKGELITLSQNISPLATLQYQHQLVYMKQRYLDAFYNKVIVEYSLSQNISPLATLQYHQLIYMKQRYLDALYNKVLAEYSLSQNISPLATLQYQLTNSYK